jgi:hypothetical protein
MDLLWQVPGLRKRREHVNRDEVRRLDLTGRDEQIVPGYSTTIATEVIGGDDHPSSFWMS